VIKGSDRNRATYSESEILHLFGGERHGDFDVGWRVCALVGAELWSDHFGLLC
jgi:hypothetical protein